MNISNSLDIDFDEYTVRKENISGKYYYYGYRKIAGKVQKIYIGKNLDKLSKMEKVHIITKKKKLSNGQVINFIFQKLSRNNLDYTDDKVLNSAIDKEIAECFNVREY